MAGIHSLSLELLCLILEAVLPFHWNTTREGREQVKKRLVCRSFDTVFSGDAFRKLDFDELVRSASSSSIRSSTATWLLYQKVRLERDDECSSDCADGTVRFPTICNGYTLSYLWAACRLAVHYQGTVAICNQLAGLRRIPLQKRFLRGSLAVAAFCGDESLVRSLVADGQDVNQNWDSFLGPPIYAATVTNNKDIVEFLLQCKANPDTGGYQGSLLLMAVRYRYKSLIRLLLEDDAVDPNKCGRPGYTVLWRSCFNGDLSIARLLMSHPRINSKTTFRGHNILSAAARRGHTAVVQWLLEQGDVNPDNHCGGEQVALWEAARKEHIDVVDCLLTRIDPSVGAATLWQAAFRGHESVVRLLLRSKVVSPNCYGKWITRISALSIASRNGHTGVVEMLLSRTDIDVNLVDCENRTALSFASSEGHENIVHLLLRQSGIEVERKDLRGHTPLLYAVERGHKSIVRLLLKHQATDINTQDADGETCLIKAAQNCQVTMIQLLLDFNADLSLRDKTNRTALDWARLRQMDRIEVRLLRHIVDKQLSRY